ncbi:response regulator transcription factor [Loktanella sp. SALINAS62]|uniref:response regulator transcription factor n=1 Tax=Loktanella sp. SALINAS62 TaxID=2706124 RepID=UPI001B8CEF59|nr:response regulator transcription factor [Loktanella sp. SALINAS62]MBS1302702.1 response regulator transcription factor [Loktanella sp. SALINAS62]
MIDPDPHTQTSDLRLLIADDHDLVRESIAALLKQEGDILVTTVATLDEALAAVEKSGRFDLVLLDYKMPGMNGLDGLARMRKSNDGHPVALMSGNASRAVAEEAIGSGAAGFIPKTMASRSMASAVRFMAAGEVFVPYGFMQQDDTTVGDLSPRETEVLRGIAEGKSNKEIARDLELQEVTIKLYVKTLFRKLEARNRTHAVIIARDMNLL